MPSRLGDVGVLGHGMTSGSCLPCSTRPQHWVLWLCARVSTFGCRAGMGHPNPHGPLGAQAAAGPCSTVPVHQPHALGHPAGSPRGVPSAPRHDGGPVSFQRLSLSTSLLNQKLQEAYWWFFSFKALRQRQRLSTKQGAVAPGNCHVGRAIATRCAMEDQPHWGPTHTISTPAGTAGRGYRRRGPRALTSPGLALPYQEGPAAVAWLEQQLLRLLPADALIQPPAQAAGAGRASPGCAGTPSAPGPVLPQPERRGQFEVQQRTSWGRPGTPCGLPEPQRCSVAQGEKRGGTSRRGGWGLASRLARLSAVGPCPLGPTLGWTLPSIYLCLTLATQLLGMWHSLPDTLDTTSHHSPSSERTRSCSPILRMAAAPEPEGKSQRARARKPLGAACVGSGGCMVSAAAGGMLSGFSRLGRLPIPCGQHVPLAPGLGRCRLPLAAVTIVQEPSGPGRHQLGSSPHGAAPAWWVPRAPRLQGFPLV